MPAARPATVDEYIRAAPPAGQAKLRKLRALLKKVAPKAELVMKWNTPFFVEPRFLFAFSAHKSHLSFTPMPSGLAPFKQELKGYSTTKGLLRIPYADPLPEDLIRRIAERRVKDVSERKDDAFW
jgi:uncharacterized protein YdhG (YjbR/CyaY superfamily)